MNTKADQEFLQTIVVRLSESIRGANTVQEASNLPALFWISKALALRNDKLAESAVGRLINLLDNSALGATTGRGFEVLLADDTLLNKENYAVVRLLAKQKLFAFCIPKLVDGFRSASQEVKPNYLLALSNLIRNVPSKLVLGEIDTLLPLLLQSINLNDPEVKAATIDTLSVTITEASHLVSEHIGSLISRLLAASLPGDFNTAVSILSDHT
jgi:DNA repair/transcription protein MET18/MMS19